LIVALLLQKTARGLVWDWTRTCAVKDRWATAWTLALPLIALEGVLFRRSIFELPNYFIGLVFGCQIQISFGSIFKILSNFKWKKKPPV
jgi:hypothetical protein